MKTIKDMPEQDRPREKMAAKGASALTDEELVQVILGRGVQGHDVRAMSKEIAKTIQDKKTGIIEADLTEQFSGGRIVGMMVRMRIEQAEVLGHEERSGGYRILTVKAPLISASVKPGQFVHLLVPRLDSAVLRRPFSVFDADGKSLRILYKRVGKGTHAMTSLSQGDEVSLMGPLGNGFPAPRAGHCPVLVAGGYGVAPLCFLAGRMRRKGVFFVGGAARRDILCVDEIRALGWRVGVATEDGSLGKKGFVTDVLDVWLKEKAIAGTPEFYACGPDGMLKAVGDRAARGGWTAWLSMDKHMGCGVGACLACVQKIRGSGNRTMLVRVCKEGPVFEAKEVVWG